MTGKRESAETEHRSENTDTHHGSFSWNPGPFGNGGGIFNDLFKEFGSFEDSMDFDIGVIVRLSFLESALGCSKKVSYIRSEVCGECSGMGQRDGFNTKVCRKCHGSGRKASNFGGFQYFSTCDECRGYGKVNIENCQVCLGKGTLSKNASTMLDVPSGISDKYSLSIKGAGNAMKGKVGSLVVSFEVVDFFVIPRLHQVQNSIEKAMIYIRKHLSVFWKQ